MYELVENSYGKSRVRLMKVTRGPGGSDVEEWTVEVLLRGDFESAHRSGDNSKILPTDTMKNMVYSVARGSTATSMESYAQELAGLLLARNPQVSSAVVGVESTLWKRLTIDGGPHPSTFLRGGGERQTTSVEELQARGQAAAVVSGLKDLTLLKTANSSFEGYLRDSYTTLAETKDRLFGTALEATWQYREEPPDFNATRAAIREAMLQAFAKHDSKSVQQTLYAMAEFALSSVPMLEEIELTMPNKHYLLADLSRFGQDNPNHIFVPTDEPHGTLRARLRRASN